MCYDVCMCCMVEWHITGLVEDSRDSDGLGWDDKTLSPCFEMSEWILLFYCGFDVESEANSAFYANFYSHAIGFHEICDFRCCFEDFVPFRHQSTLKNSTFAFMFRNIHKPHLITSYLHQVIMHSLIFGYWKLQFFLSSFHSGSPSFSHTQQCLC